MVGSMLGLMSWVKINISPISSGTIILLLSVAIVQHGYTRLFPLLITEEMTHYGSMVSSMNTDKVNSADFSVNYKLLQQLKLFDTATVAEVSSSFRVGTMLPDDALLRNAPISTIDVTLRGILTSSDREKSIAIMEKNQIQNSYGNEDLLPDLKARIVRIFADRVIIDNQGNYEAVLLN
ncbi:type II secretion system protein N [Yersinia enterocolitica]|uniref:type II secretion system protein N n=1 Tax=Yersinia enterocolitica TaxID=630 RepID=UPI00398CBFEE